MHDTDAVSDFAERFVRCIRMLRELTLVNHYYMPYTKLMRERIPHLSSASPLRAFSAHPPHTDRPHIRDAQYTHRIVRTKDIPSPCVFLFSYQKVTIKIAGWKTFFMEKTYADFSIARFGNRALNGSAYTCLLLSAGFLGQRPKQCRKKGDDPKHRLKWRRRFGSRVCADVCEICVYVSFR